MEYEIKGGSLPVVLCKLNTGESMVTQAGGMGWQTQDISVNTQGRGGLGGMFKRVMGGESAFQNVYTANSDNQEIAFTSTFPGDIIPVDLKGSESIVVQKQAYLASQLGVNIDMFFQKRIGSGLFGGEGFIMLELYGDGLAFLEVDGSVHEYNLDHGEKIVISTGHLVSMDSTCDMRIERVGGATSMLFGGEGFVNTSVYGPGKVYLQSMPLSKLQEVLTINNYNSTNTE